MKYCIYLYLVIISSICYGQSPNFNVSFPSPNAAALGMFGDVPVSLHNGIPAISIPLYEIKEGPIKVPISLNYHAAGVRPEVHPGWVGNNWSLSCGGMITRATKNLPDETVYLEQYNIYGLSGGQFLLNFQPGHLYNNYLQPSNWATSSRIDTLAKKGTTYSNGNNDYFKDVEPDEFTFNFNGYSGKFVFDENNQIRCISHPEIKVEMEDSIIQEPYPGPAGYSFYQSNILPGFNGDITLADFKIKGFRITTPDGIQYEFGLWNLLDDLTDFPYEFSINFFQQVYASENWDTWYLKRIKSPDGHIVSFYYGAPQDGIYSPIASFAKTVAIEKANGTAPGKGIFKVFGPVSESSSSITEYYTGKLINPTYVTKIVTSNEEINFTTGITKELKYNYTDILNDLAYQSSQAFSTSISNYYPALLPIFDTITGSSIDFSLLKWRQLNQITIKDKNTQQTYKSWGFKYTADTTQRLTLLSLEEKSSSNGDSSLKYSFTYNNSKTLPAYNSYKTDHWGFFNGRTETLGSLSDADLASFYSYKEVDTSYLYAGILEKIAYPTGGFTQFTYEPNQYTSIVKRDSTDGHFFLQSVSAKYAGGLRIKKITHYSGNGGPDLIKNYQYANGMLNGDFQYFWKNYIGKLANGNTYMCDRFVTETLLPVSTNSIGSHIGYSKVTESSPGNGYTEYYYTNYDLLDDNFSATIDPRKSRYSPFSDRSIERGLLIKKFYYNQNNILLREEYSTYPLADTAKFARATSAKNFTVLGGTAVEGSAYKIYTYPYKQKQTKIVIHDQSDSSKKLITTTDLAYDSQYSLLQEQKSVNSKGDTLKSQYKYPFNYVGQSVYDSMVAKNFISPVIDESKYRNSTFLQSAVTNYQNWGNSLYAPVTVQSKTGALASEVRQRIFAYDKVGNVLSASKEEDMKVTYVWDYNNKYPVAECINADTSSIAYTSFEGDSKGGWAYSQTPASRSGVTGVKFYGLSSGNSLTKSNLVSTTTYVVSYWSTLGTAYTIPGTISGYPIKGKSIGRWTYFVHKVTGQTSISITGSGGIDEVRLYPSYAQMKTYTYNPLAGVTASCDINSKITYYQYDGFGRLAIVKDDDNNIIKRICYSYNGQQTNCSLYGNTIFVQNFLKSNCTNDSIPGEIYYTVPANKYFAPTQAEADAMGKEDLQTNGPKYADSLAGCGPPISFNNPSQYGKQSMLKSQRENHLSAPHEKLSDDLFDDNCGITQNEYSYPSLNS